MKRAVTALAPMTTDLMGEFDPTPWTLWLSLNAWLAAP